MPTGYALDPWPSGAPRGGQVPSTYDETMVVTEATITCPECGFAAVEPMPTNACVYFYACTSCGVQLRPRPGDCCVFCSYGDHRCPPKQSASVPRA
jgi:hypothetical protein